MLVSVRIPLSTCRRGAVRSHPHSFSLGPWSCNTPAPLRKGLRPKSQRRPALRSPVRRRKHASTIHVKVRPPRLQICCSTTPSADQPAFFPRVQSTSEAALRTSQSACLAMGGYFLPSRSTLGSQAQRFVSGTLSITEGTWLPQPHQEAFSAHRRQYLREDDGVVVGARRRSYCSCRRSPSCTWCKRLSMRGG